mgnify:CR=1 FL=1
MTDNERIFLMKLYEYTIERIRDHSDLAGDAVAVEITGLSADGNRRKFWHKGYAAAMVDLAETIDKLLAEHTEIVQ